MTKISALNYYGGKSCISTGRIGVWIASLLPWHRDQTYIEPFAGMLGVLLQRAPVKCEIANDTNGHIVHWWKTVRDHGEEFNKKLAFTPHSRQILEESIDALNEGNLEGMDLALAIHAKLTMGINQGRNFSVTYNGRMRRDHTDNILVLQKRIKRVMLENRCALQVIERVMHLEHVCLYLDPPYENADTSPYGDNTVDFDALRDLLSSDTVKSRIAISGYGDSYDVLGWQRHEKVVTQSGRVHDKSLGPRTKRTEVLWTNYSPQKQASIFDE